MACNFTLGRAEPTQRCRGRRRGETERSAELVEGSGSEYAGQVSSMPTLAFELWAPPPQLTCPQRSRKTFKSYARTANTLAPLFTAFGSDGRFGPDGGDVQEPTRRLVLIMRGRVPWSGTISGETGAKFTKLQAGANHRLRASRVPDRPRGSGAGSAGQVRSMSTLTRAFFVPRPKTYHMRRCGRSLHDFLA